MTAVTFFTDYSAARKAEDDYDLAKLADMIEKTTADTKEKLPWLKFARFGDRRTDRNSLRHDANVIVITGAEGDYDSEKVTFFEACEAVEKAGIAALFYTSPSHHIDKPRWRVVCPTSKELPPSDRYKMVARVNGVLGGILAAESFTLSQSYYYGSVNRNPHHRVRVISGQYIDLLDELDAGAIGKSNGGTGTGNPKPSGRIDEVALLQEIISGANYHVPCTQLVGKWASTGVAYIEALRRLHAAFDQVPLDKRDARWKQRRNQDLPKIIRDIYGKEAQKKRNRRGRRRPGNAE